VVFVAAGCGSLTVKVTLQVPALSIFRFDPDLEQIPLDDFATVIDSLPFALREMPLADATAFIE
jgi:hypothetical protein